MPRPVNESVRIDAMLAQRSSGVHEVLTIDPPAVCLREQRRLQAIGELNEGVQPLQHQVRNKHNETFCEKIA